MGNYETGADLKADILFRGGELASGGDFDDEALRLLNRAYFTVCAGGGELNQGDNPNWIWLRPSYPGVLNLTPREDTGTAAIAIDTSALTFSAGPTPSMTGWFIKIGDSDTAYRISAHTAGSTSATIRGTFVESTVTAASFNAFRLEYDLASSMLRPISPMVAFASQTYAVEDGRIGGIGLKEMQREFPLKDIESGTPTHFSVVSHDTGTDTFTVRFNKYVTDRTIVEYDYLEMPSALAGSTEEPRVPRLMRHILADYALYLLALQTSDSRLDFYTQIASNGFKALVQEDEKRIGDIATSYGAVYPRSSGRSRRGMVRTSSGMIIDMRR